MFFFILAPIFVSLGSFKGNVRKHETMQNDMMKNSGQSSAHWDQQVVTLMGKFSNMGTVFHFVSVLTISCSIDNLIYITSEKLKGLETVLWRLLGITVTFWWLYNIPERVISLLVITRRRIKAPLFNIWARTKILMSAYLLKVGLWQRPLEALFSSFYTFHFSNLNSERRVRFQSKVCY